MFVRDSITLDKDRTIALVEAVKVKKPNGGMFKIVRAFNKHADQFICGVMMQSGTIYNLDTMENVTNMVIQPQPLTNWIAY
jgi:hypothetical protein